MIRYPVLTTLALVGLVTAPGGRAAGMPIPPGVATPPPAPAARAAARPAPIILPGPAGCTLRATKPRDPVTLEIAPGVPYARAAEIDSLEVTLPIGRDASAAGVQLAVGRVKLRGLATPAGLALYPARPFVVGEVFVPGPHSRLRWGEVAADRVAVEIELGKESRAQVRDFKGPLRASRGCADLRLSGRGGFDSYDAFGGRGSDLAAGLKAASVPISAQPNGPALAKLVVGRKAGPSEVTVIDEDDAGWSKIARPAIGDLLVVGWVKHKQLGKAPARETTFATFNAPGLVPAAGGTRAGGDASASFACPHEIPLVAEVGSVRKVVGGVGGGVHLLTGPADAEFVTVQFPDGAASWVTPYKGARFLVRRADVAGCPGFRTP